MGRYANIHTFTTYNTNVSNKHVYMCRYNREYSIAGVAPFAKWLELIQINRNILHHFAIYSTVPSNRATVQLGPRPPLLHTSGAHEDCIPTYVKSYREDSRQRILLIICQSIEDENERNNIS